MPHPAAVGGARKGVSVKTLKRALKKAGLKTTGRKAALTRRARKARLMGGAEDPDPKESAPEVASEDSGVDPPAEPVAAPAPAPASSTSPVSGGFLRRALRRPVAPRRSRGFARLR